MIRRLTRYFISAGSFFALASLAAALPAQATILGESHSFTFPKAPHGTDRSHLEIITHFDFTRRSNTIGHPLVELLLDVGKKHGSGQYDLTFNNNHDFFPLTLFSTEGHGHSQTFDIGLFGNGRGGANADIFFDPWRTHHFVRFSRFGKGTGDSDSGFPRGSWKGSDDQTRDLPYGSDPADCDPVDVPEPGTLALLGGGFIGLMYLRRRVQKA